MLKVMTNEQRIWLVGLGSVAFGTLWSLDYPMSLHTFRIIPIDNSGLPAGRKVRLRICVVLKMYKILEL